MDSNDFSFAENDIVGHHLLLLYRDIVLGVATLPYLKVLLGCIDILNQCLGTMFGEIKSSDYGIDNDILSLLLGSWSGSKLILVLIWDLYCLSPISGCYSVFI